MTDPAAELVIRAASLIRHLRRDVGVPASYRVLAILDDLGPTTVSELAVAGGTSQPTMSAQVGALVEEGLVARSPHPSDARAHLLTMTEAGRTELDEHRRRIADAIRDRLSTHTPEEIASAVAVLRSLTEKGNS
jgi:DNA-binding MarR family transcriptional regulator